MNHKIKAYLKNYGIDWFFHFASITLKSLIIQSMCRSGSEDRYAPTTDRYIIFGIKLSFCLKHPGSVCYSNNHNLDVFLRHCSTARVKNGRLELPWRDLGGGAHPLHHGGKDLAHHPVHIPDVGAGRSGRRRVEWRAVGLHLQHRATRLPQRVLRPGLPHLPYPLLGAAGDLCVLALPGVHGPRHLPAPSSGEGAPLQEGGSPSGDGGGGRRAGGGAEEDWEGDEAAGAGEAQQSTSKGVSVVHLCGPHCYPLLGGGELHDGSVHDLRAPPEASLQVWEGAMSERGGLLRLQAHWENRVHDVHAADRLHLPLPQPSRDHAPGIQED